MLVVKRIGAGCSRVGRVGGVGGVLVVPLAGVPAHGVGGAGGGVDGLLVGGEVVGRVGGGVGGQNVPVAIVCKIRDFKFKRSFKTLVIQKRAPEATKL